ncbi:MAG: reverse transcriptase/maturase family protein [Planctomycetota bacterium]|nr:reverse transcriptase/maturase family protein [Planctomycetota bacterium]
MEEISSDEVLDQAFAWLCKRRENYSHNDEVWRVRERWGDIKPQLQRQLINGEYSFSPLRRVHRTNDYLEIWSALDSLVLKAIAIVFTRRLVPQLSKRCTHITGNGGSKSGVREVQANLPNNKFVFRTDVKSYYASIKHDILFDQLKQHIDDPRLLVLLWQYMRRTVDDGGIYEDIEQGISLGCPLSPLMGALFLDLLDCRMEATGLFYVRFMDDWVVLAPTRWKLRRAIALVNQTLAELQVEQHPDKTFIGRVSRGFSFLGYVFNEAGLIDVAPSTREKHADRIHQLYEHSASIERIDGYVRRWWIWVRSGVGDLITFSWDSTPFSTPPHQIPPSLTRTH